jgi:glucose/mannose transport system substrate-binding protein
MLKLGLPLSAAACGGDGGAGSVDENQPAEEHRVTLYSWWIAPSEADALEALIDVHHADYPTDVIYNAAIESGEAARDVLAAQLTSGEPPDLFQENAYDLPAFLADHPGGLTPLTELFTEEGLFDAIVPEVIENVTFDGEIYAMPVNIHRENALHYNKRIFAELDLEPPATLEELLAACDVIKAAGIAPFATLHAGWVQRILFNALASASMGAEAYRDFFSGSGALDEAAMRSAIALLDRVLSDYVNASASDPNLGWTDAADLVLDGRAAMFIHGDWAKGYYVQQRWQPGEGFGVIGMPGASELFLYGVDVFAMPLGGPQPEAAQRFLRTVASTAAQVAFNRLKGSSPVRLDTSIEDLDSEGRATLEDLRGASVRMLTRSKVVWDDALAAFAAERDHDALLAAYVDNPP